jgi:Tfp pilus assembly PilM family ATPase
VWGGPAPARPDQALGLLDLGGRQAGLHITGATGGLLSRQIAAGVPPADDDEALRDYVKVLAREIDDTQTFYRGRYRREIVGIFAAGGGALRGDLVARLSASLGAAVELLDPLAGSVNGVRGLAEARAQGPRFVVAYGLCRWWDGGHV